MSAPSPAGAAASSSAASAHEQEQQQLQPEQQRKEAAADDDEADNIENKKQQHKRKGDVDDLARAELQAALRRIDEEKYAISNEIMELQQDLSEHRVVLEAFKKVESTRACFRMVGGVLVQRTVAEVQPVLEAHKQKVEAALEQRDKDLNSLTQKQIDFSRRYLKATGQDLPSACAGDSGSRGDGGKGTGDEKQQQQERSAGGAGILV